MISLKNTYRELLIENQVPTGEEFGYHGGTLGGKSEVMGGRGGKEVPFTGYYFYSDPQSAMERSEQFYAVDFSKYSLWRPRDSSEYFCTISGLKRIWPHFMEHGTLPEDFEISDMFGENCFSIMVDIKNDRKDVENALQNKDAGDTPATAILKGLGYEGVDVRRIPVLQGDADPDTGQFGSVIFDLKNNTVFGPYYTLDDKK